VSLVLLLVACLSEAPQPYVGDCAVYPDPPYDYGAIGIGSCLSGPVDLAWIADPGDPTSAVLLVTNANPFLDFATSSLVTIPLGGVPLDGGEITVAAAQGAGIEIPNFASSMAVAEDLGLVVVPSRFSEEGRLREEDDDVWFVDVAAPSVPALATVAANGSASLKVKEDPTPVLYLPETGLVLVGNASDESISVVDLGSSPVEVMDAVAKAEIDGIRVFDSDRSGSNIEVADLSVSTATEVPSDDWTLTYTEGTFRVWVPSGDGVRRLTSHGQEAWEASAFGVEFHADDTDGVLTEIFDPQIWESLLGTRMAFGDAGSGNLHAAVNIGSLTEWAYEASPLLEPRSGNWDAFLGGPMLLVSEDLEYLFYDGVDSPGQDAVGGIGLATSRDSEDFDRVGDMVVGPGVGAHDTQRVADPTVLFDPQARLWRMWYGAFDGNIWRVGHASSTDLTNWVVDSSPVFTATEGTHAAAPVVTYVGGWFRMWTTREASDGSPWLGLSISRDGTVWFDEGLVTALDGEPSTIDEPWGVGLQASASESWSVQGEQSGAAGVSFQGSEGLVSDQFGWTARLSTGWILAPVDGFDESSNGVSVSSWIPGLDRVYATLVGDDGQSRIGTANWNDGDPILDEVILLEANGGGFESVSVSSPVVFERDNGWGMLYAGANGTLMQIGLVTSSDGVTWTGRGAPVLKVGTDWDSVEVVPNSVVRDGNTLTLYYTGYDGERRRIGTATSTDDGANWTRLEGENDAWIFDEGAPGEFDDSEVSDAFVLVDSGGFARMWYAGNDGTIGRIGYAEREAGDPEWRRLNDAVSGETLVVVEGVAGSFDVAGVRRPVVVQDASGYTMLYSGQDSPVLRVGLARGTEATTMFREPADPTTGDSVEFKTRAGDAGGRKTIPLERVIDGFSVNGSGLSAFALDSERGFAYLASTSNSYIIVLDVRDDSHVSFQDNYLAVEAILDARTNSGAQGFRSLAVSGDRLYGLNDSPESVMIFDLSTLTDDDRADYVPEAVVGYLPTPRGVEQDVGSDTLASVGPAGLAIRGNRLFVSNFNDNSVGVYDLSLGLDGTLVDEIANLGENPHAVALSPDGLLLAVSLYVGTTIRGTAESEVVLIDVDLDSPTYLDVLARIVNR
jgi:predicted GH43/DUF377 family glycosyl hydrolase